MFYNLLTSIDINVLLTIDAKTKYATFVSKQGWVVWIIVANHCVFSNPRNNMLG